MKVSSFLLQKIMKLIVSNTDLVFDHIKDIFAVN